MQVMDVLTCLLNVYGKLHYPTFKGLIGAMIGY